MNIEKHVDDLIKDVGIAVPISPTRVCEQISDYNFSVEYKEEEMSNNNFLGISLGCASKATILVNSNIDFAPRKLFTAAHEIGHVVLHIMTGKQSEFQCTNNDLTTTDKKNKMFEYEANIFASALLMPKHLIQNDINRNDLSWKLVSDITNKCKTSLEATARRIVSLSKEPCILLIQQNHTPWHPIKSPHWPWFVTNPQFPDQLDYCDYDNLTDAMEECSLSDWGIEKIDAGEYQCKYSSIHFKGDRVDKIMTLLLLEEY